jgi:hypothetical protein
MKSLSPNRVVTALGPTAFAPLAGFISVWVAEHFPGLNIPADSVAGAISQAAIFIAGALIAHLKTSKWLDGWQKYEERQALLEAGVAPPAGEFHAGQQPVAAEDVEGPEYLHEFDEELEADVDGADAGAGGTEGPQRQLVG